MKDNKILAFKGSLPSSLRHAWFLHDYMYMWTDKNIFNIFIRDVVTNKYVYKILAKGEQLSLTHRKIRRPNILI